jgi:hypothetical protein
MAYALLRARYRSWPAEVKNREIGEADEILEGASGGDAAHRGVPVSHTCSFTCFLQSLVLSVDVSTAMFLVANATPIVVLELSSNVSLVNRDMMFDLPTPESPTMTTM